MEYNNHHIPGSGQQERTKDQNTQSESKKSSQATRQDSQNSPFKNQIEIPSISLPKGGGAIQGIGEKFEVNPATGTGSLSVPLAMSPGRNGFAPALGLTYDSGGGNSHFGLGWSVGIPNITRKTQKGLPKYQDEVESDVFILAGAEDLVPVLNEDGTRYIRQEGIFTVYRYRPRIEGLFARIERWYNTSDRTSYWRTITKDNITTIYGQREQARLSDPDDDRKIFSWYIEHTFDDKGNIIVYEYKKEDYLNIPNVVYEDNRNTTQCYLKRVHYGNTVPYLIHVPDPVFNPETWERNNNWLFELVFDYGEHTDGTENAVPSYQDQRPWPIRPDAFSSFRSGFDVRTYRRCHRILMYHHFERELGIPNYLVSSTELVYDENPVLTRLNSVTHRSYELISNNFESADYPPVVFQYSDAIVDDTLRVLSDNAYENLPQGIDNQQYQYIDLEGEGLSGILSRFPDAWYYKRNLGEGNFGAKELVAEIPTLDPTPELSVQLQDLDGDGFQNLVVHSPDINGFYELTEENDWEPFRAFRDNPNIDWNDPNLRLVDLTGDGFADILITQQDIFLWYPSKSKQGYDVAQAVHRYLDEEEGPKLVFSDAEQAIYLTDMTGDGLTDILRIRNGEVCYWANKGYGQFSHKIIMANSPQFDFSDRFDQSRLRLADIDGSGTTDIFYLEPDCFRFWFNQAGNAFSDAQELDQFPYTHNLSTVSVMDLLGRGTACVVWSTPLPGDDFAPLRYIDLMSEGKPHLMLEVNNNMGAITRMQYASSTRFYLEDRLNGNPWITKLPFPVHVLERVEIYDAVDHNHFVSRYAYHHGYFDGIEREFRGFGMVEQWDTEDFVTMMENPSFETPGRNWSEETDIPPVYTKSWFHTGFCKRSAVISRQYESEYFSGDEEAWLLPDHKFPENISTDEIFEAARALKGQPLRVEVYSIDEPVILRTQAVEFPSLENGMLRQEWVEIFDSIGFDLSNERMKLEESEPGNWIIDHPLKYLKFLVREINGQYEIIDLAVKFRPYIVTESNYCINKIQERETNRHAVFLSYLSESITFHYERDLNDPRITHTANLAIDNFGNITHSASIAYPRRETHSLSEEQDQLYVLGSENRFIHITDQNDQYRHSLPLESLSFEVKGININLGDKVAIEDLRLSIVGIQPDGTAVEIPIVPYEVTSRTDLHKRILTYSRICYYNNALNERLPFGNIESLAIPYETYTLAYSEGILRHDLLEGRITPELLQQGGYRNGLDLFAASPTDWWIPSGRQLFYYPNDTLNPEQRFYISVGVKTALGEGQSVNPGAQETYQQFDIHWLLPEVVTNPLGHQIRLERIDYRLLQPQRLRDSNGNFTEIAFDRHGMVIATAVIGKNGEGDRLEGFFSNRANVETGHLEEILNNPTSFLGQATTYFYYDLFAWMRNQRSANPQENAPNYVIGLSREIHLSELRPGEASLIQIGVTYSDGFGRELLTKVQAEEGEAPLYQNGELVLNGNNEPVLEVTSNRWVGNGRTVFNNKGLPVHQYEPFFDSNALFTDNIALIEIGVTPTLYYDPLGRNIRTDLPDGNMSRVEFSPWHIRTFDPIDTLLEPESTWVERQESISVSPELIQQLDFSGDGLGRRRAENRVSAAHAAVEKALALAATPTTQYLDTLGRPFVSIAHNRFDYRDDANTRGEYFLPNHSFLDVEGNPQEIWDGRHCENTNSEPAAITYNHRGQASDETNGNLVVGYLFAMNGIQLFQDSMDAGRRWSLMNILGNPILLWDEKENIHETQYDALQRPTHVWVRNGQGEKLVERLYYGDETSNAANANLIGQLHLHFDSAGVVINPTFDFKGNPLESHRRLSQVDYAALRNSNPSAEDVVPDWSSLDAVDAANALSEVSIRLESEELGFTAATTYDALNRPVTATSPDRSISRYTYNAGNFLETVETNLRGAGNFQLIVRNIDYNARGQRVRIQYGNGSTARFDFDPETFRLIHLRTTRNNGSELLQDIHYAYDPVGNITSIYDYAQPVVFTNNQEVEPQHNYTYDSLYQLIKATGRESRSIQGQPTHRETIPQPHPIPETATALRNYRELYFYDPAGNIGRMQHIAADNAGSWTRAYQYDLSSNQLMRNSGPGDNIDDPVSWTHRYTYDYHGCMISMPHLETLTWDHKDQLVHVNRNGDGEFFYTYDSSRQRVRKVVFEGSSRTERIYLGDYEIFRRTSLDNNVVLEELQTLHIMDDQQRVCMIETPTVEQRNRMSVLRPRFRYQLGNHLGSVAMEIDENAQVITYEEYHSYGIASYRARSSQTEVSAKRYRYTGMERDEETGLSYHMARYYVSWLGRWCTVDPLFEELLKWSPFSYSFNNPIIFLDTSGDKPTALEGAVMSEHIYEGKEGEEVGGGWKLYHVMEDTTTPGFRAGLYARTIEGKTEYTIAYAGTYFEGSKRGRDSLGEDFEQPVGGSEHMRTALDRAKLFDKALSDKELTFVGHSKGGGEAAGAALATGRDALVYNPAAINPIPYGLNSNQYQGRMTVYVLDNEFLHKYLNSWSAKPIDGFIKLPAIPSLSAFSAHSISNVVKSLKDRAISNALENVLNNIGDKTLVEGLRQYIEVHQKSKSLTLDQEKIIKAFKGLINYIEHSDDPNFKPADYSAKPGASYEIPKMQYAKAESI